MMRGLARESVDRNLSEATGGSDRSRSWWRPPLGWQSKRAERAMDSFSQRRLRFLR